MTRLTRVSHGDVAGDEEAIQDDTPAAQLVIDPVLKLQRLGLFVGAFDQRPRTRAYSPRPPRGPPLSA
jgi:hypothetical protein